MSLRIVVWFSVFSRELCNVRDSIFTGCARYSPGSECCCNGRGSWSSSASMSSAATVPLPAAWPPAAWPPAAMLSATSMLQSGASYAACSPEPLRLWSLRQRQPQLLSADEIECLLRCRSMAAQWQLPESGVELPDEWRLGRNLDDICTCRTRDSRSAESSADDREQSGCACDFLTRTFRCGESSAADCQPGRCARCGKVRRSGSEPRRTRFTKQPGVAQWAPGWSKGRTGIPARHLPLVATGRSARPT